MVPQLNLRFIKKVGGVVMGDNVQLMNLRLVKLSTQNSSARKVNRIFSEHN